eukprot:6417435-Amphidinium_carterae.2
MALRWCSLSFVSCVSGKVELDIDTSCPLLWWDWQSPFDSSIINRGVKSVVSKGTVVWSPGASLGEDRAALRHSTSSKKRLPLIQARQFLARTSEEGRASGCMVRGTPLPTHEGPGLVWKPPVLLVLLLKGLEFPLAPVLQAHEASHFRHSQVRAVRSSAVLPVVQAQHLMTPVTLAFPRALRLKSGQALGLVSQSPPVKG